MKKRWIALLGSLLIAALVVTACGPEPDPDIEEPVAPPEEACVINGTAFEIEDGAEIAFSGWGDETEQQIYRDSIDRFQEVCPGVVVEYEPIPADFQTKLKAQMAGGTAPDVFYVDDQLMTAFAPQGQLLPLDEYMAEVGVSRDDFIPALLTIFTLDDETYGLPKDWGTLGLVYIPEIFDDAGIDYPTEDWSWEDLREAAVAIEENTDVAGFCQGADWARFAPFVFSNSGAYTNDDFTEATLNTPEVTEMATFVNDMFQAGELVRPADVDASWCGEAIGRSFVGMTLEGGWMVQFMRQTYPDQSWNTVLIPRGPVTRANVIFTNAIGVNAFTPYPRAAAAFTMYVTGSENQAEIVQTGFAYSTHPEQVDLIEDERDRAIAEGGLLEDSRVAYWGPNTGRVNEAVSQALERIFLGDQTVDQAFDQAQQDAQRALEEVLD